MSVETQLILYIYKKDKRDATLGSIVFLLTTASTLY